MQARLLQSRQDVIVIMAVLRIRSKKFLLLLAVSVVVIFTMRRWFGVGDNTVNKKNIFSGNWRVASFFKNRNGGGSRANHSVHAVDELIAWYLTKQHIFDSRFKLVEDESYADFLKKLNQNRPIGGGLNLDLPDNGHSWQRFYRGIDQYALYNPDTQNTVEELLRDLATGRIVKSVAKVEYSQATAILNFSNGALGVLKPQRFGRDYQTPPDLMYFSEFDRHNAEIAAFHLDRVLGFYRTPPTAGRMINASSDVSGNYVLRYKSPVGNSCFLVETRQYYGSSYGLCGNPHMLEASVAIALPGRLVPGRSDDNQHPWARTYTGSKAPWEVNEDYCEKVVKSDLRFSRGRILLDLMDLAVFDFLTGNMNRSHYERFPEFAEDTFLFHVDNAGGFSKANYDCNSCLAPVRQCCMIRQSTTVKLIKLYQGPDSLSSLLRKSLNSDPLAPILLENHLDAVDRRLSKVLKTVANCVSSSSSWDAVVIDDEF